MIGDDPLIAAFGFELIGTTAGAIAILGMLFVLPLYYSQARDLRRLRRWRELEPERGDPDPFAAPAPPEVAAEQTTATAPVVATARMSEAARRVTSERPALSRITMERPALSYETDAGGFAARIPQPRHPLAIAAVVVLAAVALSVIALAVWSAGIGSDENGASGPEVTVDTSEFGVTVLNGTSKAGATPAALDDVSAQGFEIVESGSIREAQDRSTVYFTPGNEDAADVLAREIGVARVRPVPDSLAVDAIGADLLFVIGEDRLGKRR